MFALSSVFAMLVTLASVNASTAQARDATSYPARPVRIVVGFTPGGTPDINARLVGAKLSESLGQQFIVDNRPGAGGTIGAKLVADSNFDGHTLLSTSSSHVLQSSIYAKLPYDTLKDFAGVTRTSPTTPAEFDKMIAKQVAETAKLARAAGITPQ